MLKKSALSLFVLIFLASILPAQNYQFFNDNTKPQSDSLPVFKLNPYADSVFASIGFSLATTGLILDKVQHVKEQVPVSDFSFTEDQINKLDRLWYNKYSKPIDTVADVITVTAVLAPALEAIVIPNSEILPLAVMYAETALLTQGTCEILKMAVNKPRPYMYFDGYPQKEVDNGDWCCSFPSKHTAFAFTAATFATYTVCKYFPSSPWRFAVTGGSYAIAAAVGILRIASGNHFITDVLTGAAIGSLYGFVVPWVHSLLTTKENEKFNAGLSPAGLYFCIKL